MADRQGYITIDGSSEASFTEKKSEFIGYMRHVTDNDEAVAFIEEIRALHRRATHNVYAYIVRKDNVSRYSDDGEPQGTAGVPVLEVLNKEGLTDVCCVVTRYFGGILLGGGGLVRAYSHCAKLALDAARRVIMLPCFKLDITVSYPLYGKVEYLLPSFEVKSLGCDFGADVKVSVLVKSEKSAALVKELNDVCNGDVKIVKSNEMSENFA